MVTCLMTRQNMNQYATPDDFRDVFLRDVDGLYQLAYLLTASHEIAHEAFVSGIEDAVNSNRVFRDWARSWARRSVIQNAIRLLHPYPVTAAVPAAVQNPRNQPQISAGHFEVGSIVQLETFERFVFVMTVLERYSDQEAALFLGCVVYAVREARASALEQLMNSARTGLAANTVA